MQVLAHISLNFQQPNFVTVYAAQNDKLSRYINTQLLDGATPWTLPAGGLMTIRYRKPDGTSGFYDTLEDGSPAYNVEADGTVTLGLAEQALTVPGMVPMELNFYNAAGSKLSTLTFIVAVKPSAYSDEDIASSDYYNVLTAKMQQLAELADQAEDDYQEYLSALSGFVGAPLQAPTAADMLDEGRIYVYTGSETGWTYGDWYYYDGREWVSGGVYNSAAISLDDTLTNANKPAQAKAAGDLVLVQDTQPSAPVNKLWFPLTEPDEEQVPTWDEFSELKSAFDNLVDLEPIGLKTYYPLQMGSCYQSGVSVYDMAASTTLATVPQIIPADNRTLAWNDAIYKLGMVPLTASGAGKGEYYWYESSPHTFNPSTANPQRTFMLRRKDDADIGQVDLNHLLYEPSSVENPIVEQTNVAKEAFEEELDAAVVASAAETWQGFVKYNFPSEFTWADNPVADKVTTDGQGRFRVDYNALDSISTTGLDVYVAADGNDANDGLTSLTPKKTLVSAIGITNARRVHIAGGYYPRTQITGLTKDIDLIGDADNRPVFTGQDEGVEWAATAITDVYTTAHKNNRVPYDLTDSSAGTFLKYTAVSSSAAVEATEKTYYDDGTTVTIHTPANVVPSLETVCYAAGFAAMRIELNGHSVLAANLCFKCGGTYSGQGQFMLQGDTTLRGSFVLYNCDSSYSIRPAANNISGGHAIIPSNADGIVQYCTAYHSGNDGFSYAAGCKVVEIGCVSAFNGTDVLTSCNGSTAHGGSYIRINGAYHDTHGPVVHDVGATESVNLGLAAWHSTCEGKPNFCASGGAVNMWLDSCAGYSSDAGIDVGKPDESAPNAVIYKRNCTSDVADGVYGGHIYRY